MTHYNDYPYPSPDQYTPQIVRALFSDVAPRKDTWSYFFPSEVPDSRKRALVIGCGITEAVVVAKPQRWRIAQILNCDDAKISGLCRRSWPPLVDTNPIAAVRPCYTEH